MCVQLPGHPVTELRVVLLREVRLCEPRRWVDSKEFGHLGRRNIQTLQVESPLARDAPNWSVNRLGIPHHAPHDPIQHAGVVTKSGPDVRASSVLAEPVDLVDLGQFVR